MNILEFQTILSHQKRYALALLIFFIAFALRLILFPVELGLAFITFFPAMVLTFALCGVGPGVLVAIMSAIIGEYLFIPPHYSFKLNEVGILATATFLFSAYLIGYVVNRLHKSSEKNNILLRYASDGISIMNEVGDLIEVSDSFCNMLGYTRAELIGMNIYQWDDGFNNNEEVKAALKHQLSNPITHQFESKHKRKDGSIYEVEISGFPFVLGGKPVLFNSSRDITDRKQIVAKLQQSEERLRAIADNVHSVMFLKELSGRYLYINKQYEKLEDNYFCYHSSPEEQEIVQYKVHICSFIN